MPIPIRIHAAALIAAAAFGPTIASAAQAPAPVGYHRQIRPIVQAHCQGCHQPAKAESGYVMTDVLKMLGVGDSGSAGVVPEKLVACLRNPDPGDEEGDD